jgi:hypothetical protein
MNYNEIKITNDFMKFVVDLAKKVDYEGKLNLNKYYKEDK